MGKDRLDSRGRLSYISATVASSGGSEASQSMQRVRVAMTGLASVFVFIGLASAAFNYESKETAVAEAGAVRPDTVANIADPGLLNVTDEPLAELGIAPSTVPADTANSTAPAKR